MKYKEYNVIVAEHHCAANDTYKFKKLKLVAHSIQTLGARADPGL